MSYEHIYPIVVLNKTKIHRSVQGGFQWSGEHLDFSSDLEDPRKFLCNISPFFLCDLCIYIDNKGSNHRYII